MHAAKDATNPVCEHPKFDAFIHGFGRVYNLLKYIIIIKKNVLYTI